MKDKGRPPPGFTLHKYLSSVAFHNPVGDTHSQSGIGHPFCGEKGIKNPSSHLFGHTDPGIGDPHLYPVVCLGLC